MTRCSTMRMWHWQLFSCSCGSCAWYGYEQPCTPTSHPLPRGGGPCLHTCWHTPQFIIGQLLLSIHEHFVIFKCWPRGISGIQHECSIPTDWVLNQFCCSNELSLGTNFINNNDCLCFGQLFWPSSGWKVFLHPEEGCFCDTEHYYENHVLLGV